MPTELRVHKGTRLLGRTERVGFGAKDKDPSSGGGWGEWECGVEPADLGSGGYGSPRGFTITQWDALTLL